MTMDVKNSVFVIYVGVIIYLLLYNLHGCTFKYNAKVWRHSLPVLQNLKTPLTFT